MRPARIHLLDRHARVVTHEREQPLARCLGLVRYTDIHTVIIARSERIIERLNREIRRKTRVVGTFPDGRSALMLVTARFKYVAESEWGSRRYLDVTLLEEAHREAGL